MRSVELLRRAVMVLAVAAALASFLPASASATAWTATGSTTTRLVYNQGVTFDAATGFFFFDGVSSAANSNLYKTDSALRQLASKRAFIPATPEGYNHAGDLTFDPGRQRLLVPLECYHPRLPDPNTCKTGAVGVVDPACLRFLYYVNLAGIQKAMWAEISPDGKWVLTSSGRNLLAYRATDINSRTAAAQRRGKAGAISYVDLGTVLPAAGVTGATFYLDPTADAYRLLVSLNNGGTFAAVSYSFSTAGGVPTAGSPVPEITVTRSSRNNEPEGLAWTPSFNGSYPLGGAVHWQMLPSLPLSTRILNYVPVP